MKKLVLAAMIAAFPLSAVIAGEQKASGSAQTAPIPDWDKRVAGQGISK